MKYKCNSVKGCMTENPGVVKKSGEYFKTNIGCSSI